MNMIYKTISETIKASMEETETIYDSSTDFGLIAKNSERAATLRIIVNLAEKFATFDEDFDKDQFLRECMADAR